MSNIPTEFSTIQNFKKYLGINNDEYRRIISRPTSLYSIRTIPKRSGGHRVLLIPQKRLKFLQRKILEIFKQIYVPRRPVHGFVGGRGVISNAASHSKRQFVLNVDISNFFGSINTIRIRGLFRSLGINHEVVEAICKFCLVYDQLPQGAPTSPILSNMIAFKMDRDLMNFTKGRHLRYTRYADDISFSSYRPLTELFSGETPEPGRLSIDEIGLDLKAIFVMNRFELNPGKIWYMDKGFRKDITGLVVNEFPNVRRTYIRNLRAIIFDVEKNGPAEAQIKFSKITKSIRSLKHSLKGKIQWVGQVKGMQNQVYRKMAKKFNKLYPDTPIKLLPDLDELLAKAVWVVSYNYDKIGKDGSSDAATSQGTAFFLKDVGLISAAHVFEDLPNGKSADIFLGTNISEVFEAIPTRKYCLHTDLVILDHNIPENKFHSLERDIVLPTKRDKVRIFGYPDYGPGQDISELPGVVSNSTVLSAVRRIEVTANITQGISGGPVLGIQNKVIGVTHKGPVKSLATHIDELRHL